jgi:hypothetical protein
MPVRTDPTDNGGLFVGRRPGTAPVHYADTPERRGGRQRIVDTSFAIAIAVVMVVVAAACWGPIPLAWLWICGQINFHTDSVSAAIFIAFLGMILTMLAVLALVKRLDQFWILVRRAAGHDQKTGIIGPVFGVAAIIGASAFTIWLVFIAGLGPTFAPGS